MKKLSHEYILDQRKPVSHILFIIIGIVTVTVVSLKDGTLNSLSDKIRLFLLLIIQLEIFLLIAGKLFKGLRVGLTRSEITGIIVTRFVLFIIACFTAALIIYLTFRISEALVYGDDIDDALKNIFVNEFGSWFKSTLGGLTFGAVIFIVIQWQDALQREQKLREENLIFQVETLKNQINPHFLFNSLNTLSSLISSNPDNAEKFIGRLSSIYRYILENSKKNKVSLVGELAFIKDYFFLHQIRDEDKIMLESKVYAPEKYDILPVSLQILVENAINHNMATRENPLRILIYDEADFIVVKNNLQKKTIPVKSTQTGLKNLSERVKIVTGRSILIEETNSHFLVKIPLLS
jgi:sensor histidine kinase YesM